MNNVILIRACTLGLVACRSQYIMSTKDGKMIATDSKPTLDKTTGMDRLPGLKLVAYTPSL
ncbi:MAG: YgdI/YgdR family lipoprotein [Shewanella sp.]